MIFSYGGGGGGCHFMAATSTHFGIFAEKVDPILEIFAPRQVFRMRVQGLIRNKMTKLLENILKITIISSK